MTPTTGYEPPLQQQWRRRRRKSIPWGSVVMLLLMYTLTVVLVPPWPSIHVYASQTPHDPQPSSLPVIVPEDVAEAEAEAEENLVYTGGVGAGLVRLMGGVELDRRDPVPAAATSSAAVQKEVGKQREVNGKPRNLNVKWGWENLHYLSADEIFGNSTDNQRKKVELRKREDELDDLDDDNIDGSALVDGLGIIDGMDEHRAVEKRQSSRRKPVHLTFNTCIQPRANATAKKKPNNSAPQLIVYVSNTTENKAPGPSVQGKVQFRVPIEYGFGELDFDATGDVYVGVYGPNMPDDEIGMWSDDLQWNYELALSTNEPYHGFQSDQFLYLVDTDDTTALLITGNMTETASEDGGMDETKTTEQLMNSTPPYAMYAQSRNDSFTTAGLERSYCAITNLLKAPDSSMTKRGLGNFPKQQFHLKGLNRSSEYLGYLARPRNISDPSDTSGILWQPVGVNTKKDGNCQIIYNLDFCAEVAYAVPSNPTLFDNNRNLTTFYDDIAKSWHQNFTYSLQQIQCNASSASTFSLVRNCDDCAAAYKNWLCAVTIPRCMDYSSNLTYLAERSSTKLFWNATAPGWQKHPYQKVLSEREISDWQAQGGWVPTDNKTLAKIPSRNALIDDIVRPGAYKEVKPCKDLCWSLVQDCPANMGFQCPKERSWGLQMSYGERDLEGDVTCSYLGAVYFLSAAPRQIAPAWKAILASVAAGILLLLA